MSVKERLANAGYEDALTFENPAFETAFIGVSHDGRAIYDYDLMVKDLVKNQGWSEEEAIDWIEYNTIRSIGYWGPKAPIVLRTIE